MNLYKPGQKVRLSHPSPLIVVLPLLAKLVNKPLTISYLLPLRFKEDTIMYKLKETLIAISHIYLKPIQPPILTNRRTIK